MDLDAVDTALVRALQADGRASFEALAKLVGLSRVATSNRVQRLLDSGAIRVAAVVHPAARGLYTLGHLAIDVTEDAATVARTIAAKPEMPLVSIVAGRHAVIAEVRTEDMAHLRATVTEVRGLPQVYGVGTAIYTRWVKDVYSPGQQRDATTVVAPPQRTELDPVDQGLLALLQNDGRMSYAELGRAVNVSASSARARVRALFDAGIVHIAAIIRPGMLGLSSMCGFGLTLDTGPGITDRIAQRPEVYYLTESIGTWDAVGTVLCSSSEMVSATLDLIRGVPGVVQLEAWMHLDVVKEDYSLPALFGADARTHD